MIGGNVLGQLGIDWTACRNGALGGVASEVDSIFDLAADWKAILEETVSFDCGFSSLFGNFGRIHCLYFVEFLYLGYKFRQILL